MKSFIMRCQFHLPEHWDHFKAIMDVIKNVVGGGGCLEQLRNAPPSGATINDYVSLLII
jgi:hypothetical protein